jgi:Flp pilus assembly protein TadD
MLANTTDAANARDSLPQEDVTLAASLFARVAKKSRTQWRAPREEGASLARGDVDRSTPRTRMGHER